ncbi:MAG: SDR family oxidoreductase [Saprospiraceae bacterium]|nr:SDR family oxidoreductase [Saprospiraceae bacterium]MCF8252754.1 SDR family oxidoreductase [Saprospiraceae bacterium]MCF8283126.1 SDR family oxidoreductase [Bacteroidales bacterium]MCF8314310.1 SDR family oxidoreductase [Saprospiraceae bacterium]MCF8443181.1 SDR family oxidoreductase [Saprospiraceae bacterium]
MSKLSGKTAVITGGTSGIGFATAQLFLKEGAKVIITGRNPQAVEEAVINLGTGAHGIVSDTANMAHVNELPERIKAISTKVDVLFVNAGVGLFAPFEQTDEALFDANLDINFKGAFFTVQKLLPLLPDGASVILNTTILVHSGLATASAYSASKGALLSLGKTLAIELAERKIRVNCIAPGPITTPLYGKMGMPEDALNEFAAGVQAKVPLKTFGQPEHIAQTALFLASSDSAYVTGAEISVDGGKSMAF